MDNEKLEIGDVENFKNPGELVFSHQSLVMKSMNRVVEIAGHELHQGFNETVETNRGLKQIYRESTQEAFIEAVKTCEMVMSCDLDETAKNKIKKIKEKLSKKREELLDQQWGWWNKLNQEQKRKILVVKDAFISKTPMCIVYMKFETDAHREIFSELTILTKRLDFFASEDFEN